MGVPATERKDRPLGNEEEPSRESIGSILGAFVTEIDVLLGGIIPDFSNNGYSPEEKDLYRATLAYRILMPIPQALTQEGKPQAVRVIIGMKKKVFEVQERLFDDLCEGKTGDLPEKTQENLKSISSFV